MKLLISVKERKENGNPCCSFWAEICLCGEYEKIILLFNQSQIGDGFDLICRNSVEIFYHLKLLLLL